MKQPLTPSSTTWKQTLKNKLSSRISLIFLVLFSLSGVLYFINPWTWSTHEIKKSDLAHLIKSSLDRGELPKELQLFTDRSTVQVEVDYGLDLELQTTVEKIFQQYRPDYGAFVALDASTGLIKSMVSFNPIDPGITDHLALRSTFPSASIFKIITAAAAISERKATAQTIIPFSGRAHTLYKSNVLKEQNNRWTTHSTLKQAFARSINTVFGKIGVFLLGPSELNSYAARFGFNQTIHSDVSIQIGRTEITEDPWEIAEAASGFTTKNTLSPIHGAMIAASIVNEGRMMLPYLIQKLRKMDGSVYYTAVPEIYQESIRPDSAFEMRELMRETIRSGTSRSSFKGFLQSRYGIVDIGGKTGSLTGFEPRGKYDWFIGYASLEGKRMAFATLIISKEYWKVKSAYVTRKAIETAFKTEVLAHKLAHQ